MQQIHRLPVAEPARGGADHRRHDEGVEAVAVEGDEDLGTLGHQLEDRLQAVVVELTGRHEVHAPVERILIVVRARAADCPGAHLDDALHPGHLRGPPHGAGQAKALALNLVAPVDVGIDLHDGEGVLVLVSLEYRDRNGIVAADHHRPDLALQQALDGLAYALAVARRIRLVVGEVAAVEDPGAAVAEQRPAEVEVLVLAGGGITGNAGANGRRRASAIRPDRRVGRSAGHAKDADLGVQGADVAQGGESQKSVDRLCGAEHAADIGRLVRHACLPPGSPIGT